MKNNPEDAFAVLTAAVEDCTGLWDAVWELVGVPLNGAEGKRLYEEKISETQSILRELVSHGLVELYRGESWRGGAEQETVISDSQVNSVFITASYWQPPEEGKVYVCFSATVAGKDVWRSGGQALSSYLSS